MAIRLEATTTSSQKLLVFVRLHGCLLCSANYLKKRFGSRRRSGFGEFDPDDGGKEVWASGRTSGIHTDSTKGKLG